MYFFTFILLIIYRYGSCTLFIVRTLLLNLLLPQKIKNAVISDTMLINIIECDWIKLYNTQTNKQTNKTDTPLNTSIIMFYFWNPHFLLCRVYRALERQEICWKYFPSRTTEWPNVIILKKFTKQNKSLSLYNR